MNLATCSLFAAKLNRARYSKKQKKRSRMTQDGEPQAKRVKESGDNEEKNAPVEKKECENESERNYDQELLEAAKVDLFH